MANITKLIQSPPGTREVYTIEQEVDASDSLGILTIAKTRSGGTLSQPKQLYFENTGSAPVTLSMKIPNWDNDTTAASDANVYPQIHLLPGQWFFLPTSRFVSAPTASILDGDQSLSSTWQTPSTDVRENSGVTLGANISATTDPLQITTSANGTNAFRVGDLIQIGRATSGSGNDKAEVLRVKSIDSTTTMTCYRGLYGTSAGDQGVSDYSTGHASGSAIMFPMFNTHSDVFTYTTASLNKYGKYHQTNFMGKFRGTTLSTVGIVPGSICMRFYNPGYQAIGLEGITLSSKTGLTGGTTYEFSINVDGKGVDDIAITADSSNTKFGGTNGFLHKLKSALNDAENDPTKNMYNRKVIVSLVGGDILLRSAQHNSGSSIVLAQADSLTGGSSELFQSSTAAGVFPLVANLEAGVPARLPLDDIYDKTTFNTIPNTHLLATDDGNGNITGAAKGTINYETGEINITGPRFGEFLWKADGGSPFAGAINSNAALKKNGVLNVYAKSCSPILNSKVLIKAYN